MVKKKKIIYRAVLILNGKYNKLYFKTKDRSEALNKFNHLLKENERVVFPRAFTSNDGIFPTKYQMYLMKSIGPDSNTDAEGYELFDDNWKIIRKADFKLEETFFMYGYDSRYERKDIIDIVELLLKEKSKVREMIVVHNKIVIYNDELFDMVICKCIDDARRLYKALYGLLNKIKGTKFIFMGVVTSENLPYMNDIIQEETGWNRLKIHRKTTKP